MKHFSQTFSSRSNIQTSNTNNFDDFNNNNNKSLGLKPIVIPQIPQIPQLKQQQSLEIIKPQIDTINIPRNSGTYNIKNDFNIGFDLEDEFDLDEPKVEIAPIPVITPAPIPNIAPVPITIAPIPKPNNLSPVNDIIMNLPSLEDFKNRKNKRLKTSKVSETPKTNEIEVRLSDKEIITKNSHDRNGFDILSLPHSELQDCVNDFDLKDVEIIKRDIGVGKTATVHKGKYTKNNTMVALKDFKVSSLTEELMSDVNHEISILKSLKHENIASLYGTHINKINNNLLIMLEWLDGGCLYDIIHNENIELSYNDILIYALDIARGMRYLHSLNIAHRDLKPHNILLDKNNRVKITDFGTADYSDKILPGEIGTIGYTAPEIKAFEKYGLKCDVFSFGVILWELITRNNGNNILCYLSRDYVNKTKSGVRPKIPNNIKPEYKELINCCWEFNPKNRPSFNEIVKYLEKLIFDIKIKS